MTATILGAHGGRIEQLIAGRGAVIAASADGVVAVWPTDGVPPRVLASFDDDGASCVALGPDGLVVGSTMAVVTVDRNGGEPEELFEADDCIPVALAIRGDRVAIALHDDASGSDHPIVMLDGDGEVAWRAETRYWPYALAFDPRGDTLVVASWSGELHRFDARTGKLRGSCLHARLPEPVRQLAWLSPTELAIVGLKGTLAIVDPAKDAIAWQHADAAGLHAVACSADRRFLAVGGNRGVATIFDRATRAIVAGVAIAPALVAELASDDDDDDDGGAMYPSSAEYYTVAGPTAIHALAFHHAEPRLFAGLECGAIVELDWRS